jgi:hypothetical protein
MYRQSGRNDQEFRLLELDSGPNADVLLFQEQ